MNGKGYGKLSIVTATQLLKANEHVMNISVRGNHLTTEAGSLFTQGMSSINNDNDSSNSSSSSSSSGMSNSFCKLDLSFNLINLNVGDIVIFSNKCPHRSKKNYSNKNRRIIYYTYTLEKNGSKYEEYFRDKEGSKNDSKSLSEK